MSRTTKDRSIIVNLLENNFAEVNKAFKQSLTEKVSEILELAEEYISENLIVSEAKKCEEVQCKCGDDGEDCDCEDKEELKELSKKTLGSYVKKAAKDAEENRKSKNDYRNLELRYRGGGLNAEKQADIYKNTADEFAKKHKNRHKGISKAVDKLTKESVNAVEEGKSLSKSQQKYMDNLPGEKQRQKDEDSRILKLMIQNAQRRAKKKVTEENLEEISSKTLKSYVKKAADWRQDNAPEYAKTKDFETPEDYYKKKGSPYSKKELANKYKKKFDSRTKMMNKAVDKLSK